jgi:uncharacterized OsmC-like protein/pimeloyl-ACP methyl ester carboxylesterase
MVRPPREITFTGSQNTALAARLDTPTGPVSAYALFAHCFTCSKDIFAASRIAEGLTRHGIAVLRFDFTGLGASKGEFANTNFSSNVTDIVRAAGYLREKLKPPTLLIGHSLGGAAVLAAAGEIPEAKAVVTIGAPADAEHVIDNFRAQLGDIERAGVAEVSLAGRKFTIRKQFLDDVRGRTLADKIAGLRRALLVMHAPRDEVVGIDNASRIFAAAKHPKSFISLDSADHLLSRRADAEYAANIIAAWASRFVAAPGEGDAAGQGKKVAQPGLVVASETGNGKFQQQIASGRHMLISDEPEDVGGRDGGSSPYDYLAIALGACTSMTLRLYAERRKLPLEHVEVEVTHTKVHAEDCAECEHREGRVDHFERCIILTGTLNSEERAQLVQIADKCPVHRTLEQSSVIVTHLKE